jgi:hypothetical protein
MQALKSGRSRLRLGGGKQFDEFLGQGRADVAIGLLPLILLGIGASSVNEYRGAKNLLSWNDQLGAAGVVETDRVAVIEAAQSGDMGKAQSLLMEAWGRRNPEVAAEYQDAMSQRQTDMSRATAELERLGAIPTLRRDGEGWTVTSNGTSTKFATWEEARDVATAAMGDMERAQTELVASLSDSFMASTPGFLKGESVEFNTDAKGESLVDRVNAGAMTPEQAMEAAVAGGVIKGVTMQEARAIAAEVFGGQNASERAMQFRQDVEKIAVLGRNTVQNGQSRSIVNAAGNERSFLTVVEEVVEGRWKGGLERRAFTKEQGVRWVQLAEAATGEKFLEGATWEEIAASAETSPRALTEAISRIAVADVLGRMKDGKRIGPGTVSSGLNLNDREQSALAAILDAFRKLFKALLETASKLAKARQDGKLGGEYDALFDALTGGSSQLEHDAGAAKEADAIASEAVDTSGYSPETPGPNGETFSTSRATPADSSKVVQMPDGAQLVGPTTFSIRAYHGTPHKVDKFKLDKIGTGEGAQAYGWGLYFAESKGVADQYRKVLVQKQKIGKSAPLTAKEDVQRIFLSVGNIEEVKNIVRAEIVAASSNLIEAQRNPDTSDFTEAEANRDLKRWQAALSYINDNYDDLRGNLYTVELLPNEDEFLDWDKPLSEQPATLQQKLNDEFKKLYQPDMTVSQWHAWMMDGETDAKTLSNDLAALGIPGIKYLDGGSRGKGDGTRNFVIFDENLVRILEENGKPVETFSLGKVTPAQDAEYMAAVEAGDMKKAQRMVDEAARAAIESNPRNAVKLGRFLSKSEYESVREQIEELPREVFYVGNVEVIRNPTGDDIRGMTNEERSARGGRRSVDPDTRFTKDNYGNTWRWKATGGMHSMIEPSISRREGVEVNQNNGTPYHSDLVKDAIRSGEYIPSSTLSEYPNYADFVKPSSADPVTYDDAGNVIPLSQRFNPADNRITFSLGKITPAQDAEYMAAVEAGDMEKAQRMVDEAAKAAGYLPHADFRDAHRAPSGPAGADEEVRNGDADASLVQVARGVHNQPDNYFDPRVGPRYYSYQDKAGMEAFKAIRAAMDKIQRGKKAMVTVFRAVPIDIKGARLENRDWVTPSKTYAIDHGESRFGEDEYRIVEEAIPAENLFWDSNDIREWGKDDSQSYFYKNTANNIKSADPVTRDESGKIVPLSQRFNPADNRITFSLGKITPAQDAEYLAAVEAGDMEKAQRMVDEAAKAAGYDVGPVYHGTEQKGLTEFYGGWWSDTKKVTREFGSQRYSAYLKGPLADGDTLRELYKKFNGTDSDPDSDGSLADSEIADVAMSGGPFSRYVQDAGYQGIEVWDESNAETGMAYSTFNPSQIKSADPVTRDAEGNVIPLSQRFNPADNRITFSIRPGDFAAQNAEPSPGGLSEAEARNPMTIYRAGDADEVGVKPFSSWTPDEETAVEYQDNPGFGGETLRQLRVDAGSVLIADTTSRKGMRDLAEVLGFESETGNDWFDNGWRYPWEESSKVKRALEQSEFDAVQYTDDFPAGATTIIFTREPQLVSKPSFESSRAAGGTFSIRPGDFSARMEAKFSLFQAKPELRLAIAQVAKERALRLGAEWIAKGDVIRTAKDIGREARMREALAYEARMNEYLDGLTPNARQTLEFEPSALEDDPLVAAMLDFGKLMSQSTAKKSGKVDAKSGDYDGQPWLPPAWFSKGSGIMPDQMAQAMFDAGMLPDAYTGTLWSELEKRIEATRKDKAAHREAVQAYKAAEKYARDASRAEADQWAEDAKKRAGSPKAQRDAISGAARTLEGILAAAPPEVRARAGGYLFSRMAKLATDEARLRLIEDTIDKLNVELEKYLKKQAVAEISKLFKKARPDMEAGKKGKGKDADMHALFALAEEAAEMKASQVAGRLAEYDDLILNGKEVEGSEERILLTDEEETMILAQRGIVELVGNLKSADSGRAFSALDTLRDIYQGAWLKWKIAEIERKERRAGLRQDFIVATNKTGVRDERTKADKVIKSLFGKGKEWLLDLSSMREVLAYAFGLDNERVTSLVDAERTASNTYEDANQRLGDEIEGLFTAMAGTRTKGERLRWNLSQRTIKTGKGELSQLEAIQALLMWRQEDGRRHMEGTRDESGKVTSSWSYDQAWIDEIEAALTPEARQVMSFIMGKYAAEWATLNPLYRARYGVNMPHHDAYAPITVTPVQTKAGEVVDPVTGSAVSGGSILTPGSLRTRSRNAIAEPDFRDALQTMILHSRQMEYWKAYYDLAVEMNAVLGNREVMNSVHAKGGKEAANALRQWIDVIGQGGFRDASLRLALFQAGSKLQGRAAGVALLGRMSAILSQSTQLAAASVKMPVTSYLVRLAKLMTGGLGWRDAMRSDFIQRRFKTAPPIVRQAMDSLASAKPNEIQQLSRFFGNVLSGADAFFTSGTYAILLDYHREQGRAAGLTGAELDAYAHTEAERATEQVAQPTRTANRSLAELSNTGRSERSGGPLPPKLGKRSRLRRMRR